MCHLVHVTCHVSPTSTATDTDPPPTKEASPQKNAALIRVSSKNSYDPLFGKS